MALNIATQIRARAGDAIAPPAADSGESEDDVSERERLSRIEALILEQGHKAAASRALGETALRSLGVLGGEPDGGVLGRTALLEGDVQRLGEALVEHRTEVTRALGGIREDLRAVLSTVNRRTKVERALYALAAVCGSLGFALLAVRMVLGIYETGANLGWW